MLNIAMLGALFLMIALATAQQDVQKSDAPPSFFLKDPTDGSCLAGGVFKRCALDSLWYVTGRAGSYQLHKRPSDEDSVDKCLGK